MRQLTRVVWILSLVSLFTDMASEMLYPVMPVYLKSIGFSIVLIGVLEGLAEATAGLSKGYFGKRSDVSGKRVPFVQFGYTLSALSKPLMAISTQVWWVFTARTTDRLGKGIRTGARDAMLAEECTPETRGKIFGFHRSMDTLGAAIGPALALVYLWLHPGDYITLFYIAFIPGILAVVATQLLKEKRVVKNTGRQQVSTFVFFRYWRESSSDYRKLVRGLILFALFNSSDVFLLLKAKQAGLDDTRVIGIYIFYNLVYALLAFPVGIVADRLGLKQTFIGGLVLFAIVYSGMAYVSSSAGVAVLFFIYGVYAAATEGISKAWISKVVEKEQLGTAIGSYAGMQSIAALLASSVAGVVWYAFGAEVTFLLSAVMAVVVIGVLWETGDVEGVIRL